MKTIKTTKKLAAGNILKFRFVIYLIFACITLTTACMNLDLKNEMETIDTETSLTSEESSISYEYSDTGLFVSGENVDNFYDTADTEPPDVITACGENEEQNGSACLISGAESNFIRVATDEKSYIKYESEVENANLVELGELYSLEHLILLWGEAAASGITLPLKIEDINTNNTTIDLSLPPSTGVPVSITEVMADPVGDEPLNEFVKITNYGTADVDLGGYMIDDNGDYNGDILPEGTILHGNESAVITQTGSESGSDNIKIIYIPSSIGSNGLKNSESETIELYDSEGFLISYMHTTLNPKEGCAIKRILPAIPSSYEGAFTYSEECR
ncbi:MAG: lamin tail domain-containing protein [Deltaproteobacteria bacterium]|nr:lamin tail domain-containing protein [Deltaproteobacteria bacterium]